jgi:hypothetical protein
MRNCVTRPATAPPEHVHDAQTSELRMAVILFSGTCVFGIDDPLAYKGKTAYVFLGVDGLDALPLSIGVLLLSIYFWISVQQTSNNPPPIPSNPGICTYRRHPKGALSRRRQNHIPNEVVHGAVQRAAQSQSRDIKRIYGSLTSSFS